MGLDKFRKKAAPMTVSATPAPVKVVPKDTYIMNNSDTLVYLKQLMSKQKPIPKCDMMLYTSAKSVLGAKISGEPFISFHLINTASLGTTRFISISPRRLQKSEMMKFVRQYALVKKFERHPTFVHKDTLKDPIQVARLRVEY